MVPQLHSLWSESHHQHTLQHSSSTLYWARDHVSLCTDQNERTEKVFPLLGGGNGGNAWFLQGAPN